MLAIAITWLVLELRLPETAEEDLGDALGDIWPHYVAYVVTFVVVGIMWANHHGLYRLVTRVDAGQLLAHNVLLMGIAFLPFPTAVLADHWADDEALLLYGGTLVAIAVLFNVLWHYARWKGQLAPLADELEATIRRRYAAGPVLHLVAMAIAPLSVWAAVAVWLGLAVTFLFLSYRPTDDEPPVPPDRERSGGQR